MNASKEMQRALSDDLERISAKPVKKTNNEIFAEMAAIAGYGRDEFMASIAEDSGLRWRYGSLLHVYDFSEYSLGRLPDDFGDLQVKGAL